MKTILMSELKQGKSALILSIDKNSKIYQRLCDLGIIEGTKITCVNRKSGIGAYYIRGTVIAFRDDDTKFIKLQIGD